MKFDAQKAAAYIMVFMYMYLNQSAKKFWLQNKKCPTCGETITTGGGLGLSLGSWIGSAFCGRATFMGLTSKGSVLIASSILVVGSSLTSGLVVGKTASLLSYDVILLEWLSLRGDLILFS